MERVYFFNNKLFYEKANKAFLTHKNTIMKHLPEADIQHVGSSAIPNSLSKGDLDIQVRVSPGSFPDAVRLLSELYDRNNGSIKTDSFRAFEDDSANPPLGIQLTVINSDYDFFWKFRDVLLFNDIYRIEYDHLKRKYEGENMDDYRQAKNKFFQKLMKSPEFKKL